MLCGYPFLGGDGPCIRLQAQPSQRKIPGAHPPQHRQPATAHQIRPGLREVLKGCRASPKEIRHEQSSHVVQTAASLDVLAAISGLPRRWRSVVA